jgi:hypothetical protein
MKAALSVIVSGAMDDDIIAANPALQIRRRTANRANKLGRAERLQMRPMSWEPRDAFLAAAKHASLRSLLPRSPRRASAPARPSRGEPSRTGLTNHRRAPPYEQELPGRESPVPRPSAASAQSVSEAGGQREEAVAESSTLELHLDGRRDERHVPATIEILAITTRSHEALRAVGATTERAFKNWLPGLVSNQRLPD